MSRVPLKADRHMVTSIIKRTMNAAVRKVAVIARCLFIIALEIIIPRILCQLDPRMSVREIDRLTLLRLRVYEGKSSFKDYLGQFELDALANKSDKQTSAIN